MASGVPLGGSWKACEESVSERLRCSLMASEKPGNLSLEVTRKLHVPTGLSALADVSRQHVDGAAWLLTAASNKRRREG